MLNIIAGWCSILLGGLFGAAQGMFFYQEKWLGGYNSWKRRISRLGHVSFFGIGFTNIAFGLTVRSFAIEDGTLISSYLLLSALVTMPLVCYLSSIRDFFRHVFFIPALSVILGVSLFIWRLFQL